MKIKGGVMLKIGRNPFQILGLDKGIISVLDDNQLKSLVDRQYLTLQQFFHPDKGGAVADSQALNWARDQLRDPAQFSRWKKDYTQSPKTRAKTAQVRFEQAHKDMQGFRDYFMALCYRLCQMSTVGQYIDLLGVNEKRLRIVRPAFDQKERDFLLASGQDSKKLFNDLFLENGRLMVGDHQGRVSDYSGNVLLGVVMNHDILQFFGGIANTISRFFSQIRKDAPLLTATDDFEHESDYYELVTNISPNVFMSLLPHLRQKATGSSHLFSCSIREGVLRFCYEGSLARIETKAE